MDGNFQNLNQKRHYELNVTLAYIFLQVKKLNKNIRTLKIIIEYIERGKLRLRERRGGEVIHQDISNGTQPVKLSIREKYPYITSKHKFLWKRCKMKKNKSESLLPEKKGINIFEENKTKPEVPVMHFRRNQSTRKNPLYNFQAHVLVERCKINKSENPPPQARHRCFLRKIKLNMKLNENKTKSEVP